MLMLTCSLGAGVWITWSLVLISTSEAGVGCDRWCSCAETGVVLPPSFMTSVS